jgi:hypothetical protein
MQSYRRWDWGDQLAADGAIFLVVLTIIVFAIIVAAIVAMVKELGRIYAERGSDGSTGSRMLWYTLLGFLAICALALVLFLAVPAATTAAVYLAAWSFLGLVLVAEGVDWYARRRDHKKLDHANELDTYLDFSTPLNGHGQHDGELSSVTVPSSDR